MFVVYSKPNCTFCDQAKKILSSNNQEYREVIIDVGQPRDSDQEYITLQQVKGMFPTARSAPIITKSDTMISFGDLRKMF